MARFIIEVKDARNAVENSRVEQLFFFKFFFSLLALGNGRGLLPESLSPGQSSTSNCRILPQAIFHGHLFVKMGNS